jgi:uncharacterized protein (DUF2141 family)
MARLLIGDELLDRFLIALWLTVPTILIKIVDAINLNDKLFDCFHSHSDPIPLAMKSSRNSPKFILTAHRSVVLAGAVFAASTSLTPVQAADVSVQVSGVAAPLGQIGCTLFSSPEEFPMDNRGAKQLWVKAALSGVTCRFENVPEGKHAVSIGHDVTGNKKVDTNFVGMPTEQWGVSNNVRPTLRPPKYEEAAFEVRPGATLITLDIKVAK